MVLVVKNIKFSENKEIEFNTILDFYNDNI